MSKSIIKHKAIEPNQQPLRSGDYVVEAVATRDTNADELALQLKVLEGPHEGHLLPDTLDLRNPSPDVIKIACRTLNEICAAIRLTAGR